MTQATRTLALFAFALTLTAGNAHASLIFTMQEIGADVVLSGSGTIEVSGNPPAGSSLKAVLAPAGGFIIGAEDAYVSFFKPVTGPVSIGAGLNIEASSGAGDLFGFAFQPGDSGVFVPSGYVSGSFLSGSATFQGTSLAGLGVTPGNYMWTFDDGQTVSLTIGSVSAVPEPASLTLLGVGALILTIAARHRRRESPV